MDKPKHTKGPRRANKIGRKARPALHRTKGFCGRKNCKALQASREWSRELNAYVAR